MSRPLLDTIECRSRLARLDHGHVLSVGVLGKIHANQATLKAISNLMTTSAEKLL